MVKEEELIRKHKPLTRKEVSDKFREMRTLKKKLTTDAAILEQNLVEFNKITDPLIDPESGNVLCWIRRPTTGELEKLVPAEMMEYRDSPEEMPKELMTKYENFHFEMMADLITNPKKDTAWWKEHANMVFQQLFQLHLRSILEDLGISAENF